MPDKLTFGFERLSILLKEPNIRDLLTSYWQELTPLTGHRLDIVGAPLDCLSQLLQTLLCHGPRGL